jgi:hypothetical protein
MRGVIMKEHWCTWSVLLTYLSPIILFMCTVLKLILSNEFNSIFAVTTSMSPKGRTKPSSVDAVQASARLTMSPHSPFILAHDISRGILQPVIASINALLMVMVLCVPLFVSNSLRRRANQRQLTLLSS